MADDKALRRADTRNIKDDNFAFGRYVNSEAIEGGKKLLKQAEAEHRKRKEWADKEVRQSAKDAATYIAAKVKGRIWGSGQRYCCGECEYNGMGIQKDGRSLCGWACNNGEYFTPKTKAEGEEDHDKEHQRQSSGHQVGRQGTDTPAE